MFYDKDHPEMHLLSAGEKKKPSKTGKIPDFVIFDFFAKKGLNIIVFKL